jgi:HSP20 family protein
MTTTTNKQDIAVRTESVPAVAINAFDEMAHTLEKMMHQNWLRPVNWAWPATGLAATRMLPRIPAVDVIDQNEQIIVRCELPGIEKNNIDITMDENSLTIKAKNGSDTREQKGDYYRCEISQSAFTRSVALPGEVDPATAKAKLQDGILEVTLAKANGSRRHAVPVE